MSEETAMVNREMANEFEKSIGIQREHIYKERDRILATDDFKEFDFEQLARDVFEYDIKTKYIVTENDVVHYIYNHLSFNFKDETMTQHLESRESIINFLLQQFNKQLEKNLNTVNDAYLKLRFLQKQFLKLLMSNGLIK